MGVIIPQVVTSDRATGGQVINGSVGFTSESLTRLTRTPSSAGNRRTFTWSGWVKRYYEDTHGTLLARTTDVNDRHVLALYQGQLYFFGVASGTTTLNVNAEEFRDSSSWYHLVFSFDTTQANANDRTKFYVNGVELRNGAVGVGTTTVTYSTQPTQNQEFNINTAAEHTIGHESEGAGGLPQELNGRLSQVYFIDGQALDASYFGFTDSLTNTWKPKKYINTTASPGDAAGVVGFGTNGFYLPLDGSAPIGQDQSGQGNDWTPVNFGGTVELDSPLVSGARPILNTTQGGVVAGLGVFGSKQNVGYAVTVYDDGGGNKYYIDGVKQATLTGLIRGATYTFDTSDSTVSSHPFRFSDSDGGSEYPHGVAAITGTATTITIPHNAPNELYYYCTSHSGMGSSITGITTNASLADQYAWRNITALPLVGSNGDVSASIACTSTTKTITASNTTLSSEQSNFYNESIYFDDTADEYISFPGAVFSGEFCVEFWYYANALATNNGTVSVPLSGDTLDQFQVGHTSSNGIEFYFDGSLRAQSGAIGLDKWYHIALTRDSSNVIKLYVDGIQKGNTPTVSTSETVTTFYLGVQYRSGDADFHRTNGYIQDFRIYNGTVKYSSNFVVPSTSPSVLPDTPSGVSGSSKLTKITEGAVSFDGSNDYVVTPASSDFDFGSGDFTVEAYVRPTNATQTDPSVVSLWNFPDSRRSWGIFGNSGGVSAVYNGSIRGAVSPDGEFATRTEITGTLRLNSWNHVAFVRNGNTLNFFIDGVSQGTASYTGSVYSNTTDGVMVGAMGDASDGRNHMNAFISNVRIIKGTALYTSNFTPPSAPLTNVTNTKLLTCQENQLKILTDTTDATGGNSIQNTNNSGITSTTGNRSDSNSSSLVLAVPFNGTTDDICDEIGSNTAKAATLTNSPSSENIGHFYGKSYKFTGADGQRIDYAASADFDFGTGAFCVEGWYYHLEKTSANFARRYFVHNETAWESGRWIVYCGYTGNANRATFYTYDTYTSNGNNPFLIGKTNFAVGNWYHIAVTRSSNTFRLFVNGRLEDQDDDSNSVGNNTINVMVGGAPVQTDRTLFGHVQDLRIYKGVAKYTAPFVPPRVPTYDSAVTPSSNIIGLAGGASLPTNFNPFITDVHTVRGQESGYATMNPLEKSSDLTLSDGNLQVDINASRPVFATVKSDIGITTGKYYWEFVRSGIGSANLQVGVWSSDNISVGLSTDLPGNTSSLTDIGAFGPGALDNIRVLGLSNNTTQDNYTDGDTLGIAFDADVGKIYCMKNGADISYQDLKSGTTLLPSMTTGKRYQPFVYFGNGGSGTELATCSINFGQKPFKFAPPEGFQPLNAANTRPVNVISRPDQFVGVTTYSGDDTDPKQINLGMAPDLIWVKARNQTNWHWLTDTVRGAPNKLYANSPNAEDTAPQYGQADSLNDFGFVAGGGTDGGNPLSDSNKTGTDYVVWSWKAGGDAFTYNKDGSGGSSASDIGVSATTLTLSGASINTTSKFGIYAYTGSGSGSATITHGLGGTPGLVIYKRRTGSSSWQVYHQSLGGTQYMTLDENVDAYTSDSTRFGGTDPTSTTITLGTHGNGNVTTILYAWCDVPGLQKFGSWTGINSADGNFVELGFRPTLVIAKQVTGGGGAWFILDSKRNTQNPLNNILDANVENAERQAVIYDFLSNGFKIRIAFSAGAKFIYMAWAEAPTIDLFGGGANAR